MNSPHAVPVHFLLFSAHHYQLLKSVLYSSTDQVPLAGVWEVQHLLRVKMPGVG